MSSDAPRLKSLDSLRGFAALIVVIHHCVQYTPALARNQFLHRLFPGGGAVLIFFVLSGLVLSMTYVYRDGDKLLPFVIKRIFRIWPPFAAAIIVSACLRQSIGYHMVAGTTPTFLSNWSGDLTLSSLLSHLSMQRMVPFLDYPTWSLVQELRISLIFPFLVYLVMWNWKVAIGASVCLCLLLSGISQTTPSIASLATIARFIPLFIMGAILALKVRELRHSVGSASVPLRSAMWLLFALGIAMSADYSGPTLGFAGSIRLMFHGIAASGIVILCATGDRTQYWLTRGLPMFLGKISYSLYLIHVIVITATVQLLENVLPVPVLIILGAVLSIVIAVAMERYIEAPSAGLGRRIAERFVPKKCVATD